MRHEHALPPARLWVLQALLLLELYEKMFSTRMLHERAHIHRAATITLMRRGTLFTESSTIDSPPSVKDEKTGASRHSSTSGTPYSIDEWWERLVVVLKFRDVVS
jgi:hypothetical protein